LRPTDSDTTPSAGRARAQIVVTRTADSLHIDLPARRSTARLVLGIAALLVGGPLTLVYVGMFLFVTFTRSDILTGLVSALFGAVWLMVQAAPWAAFATIGSYMLYGRIVIDAHDDRIEMRRGLFKLSTPAMMVIRDARESVQSVETGVDARGLPRIVVALSGRPTRPRQPTSPVAIGAGYLSEIQAEQLTAVLRDYLSLEVSAASEYAAQ